MTTDFDTLRAAAVLMWADDGAWLYDTWAEHNTRYFAGALACSGLVWALLPFDSALGCFDAWTNIIHLHDRLRGVNRTPAARGPALVLLHEQMLQHIHQRTGEICADTYDKPVWIAEVNRLAILLGLGSVGRLPYPQLATFPVGLFPEAWGVTNG